MSNRLEYIDTGDLIFIYALIDPIDNTVRYIGKTSDITRRLNAHLSPNSYSTQKMDKWLSELKTNGLIPLIKELETCSRHESLNRETFHIRQAIINGANLLNANAQALDLKRKTKVEPIISNRSLFIIEE